MKKRPLIKYVIGMMLFGTNGIAANASALSSTELVYLRSAIGAVLLAILYFSTGRRIHAHRQKKSLFFLALAGVSMALDWLLLFAAFGRIGVSLSVLINYLGPVIVVALSPLLFQEKLNLQKLAAFAAAVIGVFLISGRAAAAGMDLTGLILAVLSAFAGAGLIIFNKLAPDVEGMEHAMLQLVFAAATVVLYTAIRHGLIVQIEGADLIRVLWLGVMNTGVACYLTFSEIGRLPAQTAAICTYVEPVFAVLLSVIFLGEAMTIPQIIGAVLVIGGAAFTEFIT